MPQRPENAERSRTSTTPLAIRASSPGSSADAGQSRSTWTPYPKTTPAASSPTSPVTEEGD
jgi:hypothetical protein